MMILFICRVACTCLVLLTWETHVYRVSECIYEIRYIGCKNVYVILRVCLECRVACTCLALLTWETHVYRVPECRYM